MGGDAFEKAGVRRPAEEGALRGESTKALHLGGVLMTLLIHGGIVGAIVGFSAWTHARVDEPKLREMIAIEAALAYKAKPVETKQPQKAPQRARPEPPEVAPQGVSRDEQKAPVEEKKKLEPPPRRVNEPKPEEDFLAEFEKYRQMRQERAEEEDPLLPVGDLPQAGGGGFDGSARGFAEVSRGDPYMQELAAAMFQGWKVPTLEQGTGTAVGCVRLGADGRVLDTKLWESTKNANIDRSVRVALQKLQELRERGDKPVPRHLMDVTTQWTCFKFSL